MSAARRAFRSRAASFFFRRTLGFSKCLRLRASARMPSCWTLLLNRRRPASNDSFGPRAICVANIPHLCDQTTRSVSEALIIPDRSKATQRCRRRTKKFRSGRQLYVLFENAVKKGISPTVGKRCLHDPVILKHILGAVGATTLKGGRLCPI